MGGTGAGSCPIMGFGIRYVKPSDRQDYYFS